jgi:hypothetical protein
MAEPSDDLLESPDLHEAPADDLLVSPDLPAAPADDLLASPDLPVAPGDSNSDHAIEGAGTPDPGATILADDLFEEPAAEAAELGDAVLGSPSEDPGVDIAGASAASEQAIEIGGDSFETPPQAPDASPEAIEALDMPGDDPSASRLDPLLDSAYDVSSSELGDLNTGAAINSAAPPPVLAASDPSRSGVDLSPAMQERIHEALEKVAWEAFSDVSETIVKQVLERVEKIAWEVIPQMAETLIEAEIRRMKGES